MGEPLTPDPTAPAVFEVGEKEIKQGMESVPINV